MGEISNFYNFPPRMLIFGTRMPPAETMHAAKFYWCPSDTFWVMIFFFVFGSKDLNSKPISSHKFYVYNLEFFPTVS